MNQNLRLVTFNNVGDRDELVTVRVCKKVVITEDRKNANWPTTEYNWSDVASGGVVITRKRGEETIFEKHTPDGRIILYSAGERVAFFETIGGVASADFQIVEEM